MHIMRIQHNSMGNPAELTFGLASQRRGAPVCAVLPIETWIAVRTSSVEPIESRPRPNSLVAGSCEPSCRHAC